MDKFSALKTFITVVDAGSFSRASDLLNMPKSTVTRFVKQLEDDLKVKLLHRTTRRLALTEEGEAYYQGAIEVLEDLSALDSRIALTKGQTQGKVRVELPDWLATMAVIPALPDFVREYPHIELDMRINNKSIDLVAENVDCVLRVGPIINDALIAKYVGILPVVTCAAPAYLKRVGTPLHPNDIRRLDSPHAIVRVVSPSTGRPLVHELAFDEERCELDGRNGLSVNSAAAALAAGLAGLGIVTTYGFLAEQYIASGCLVQVMPEWSSASIPIHVAWSANRHLSAKVRAFVDWIPVCLSKLVGSQAA